jgi:tRNA U34 5-methylaminomethyl-2-thiouridine-forming methyltransferase MnmC
MAKNREIVITEDGSSSLFIPELNEHYHSHFGALQESKHIFIESGLAQIKKKEINILEFGFGTGLNALQTYEYAKVNSKEIRYYGIEKHPVSLNEIELLNYVDNNNSEFFNQMHQVEWGREQRINKDFYLIKLNLDFRDFKSIPNKFDLVYYDAFGPDVQPYLWTADIFKEIYDSLSQGAILMTYTVKGDVRRALKSVGFIVEKIPGPPGKREITRAFKL